MKSFDQYEFTGVLVPGVITLFGLSRLFPHAMGFVADNDITVGDLGLFVVLAYAAGHLIQALGNIIETIFWKLRGGKPTDWVRTSTGNLLSAEQKPVLEERVSALYPTATAKTIAARSEGDWLSLTKQIYAIVHAAGRSHRVDIFNGNYGMFRGIATALVVCLVGIAWSTNRSFEAVIILGVLVAFALFRMNRFAVHYARELFVQFVNLDSACLQKGKP